ncbi:MAG TPA: hypothetical protein VE267_20295 [Bradyrhizobium sp.]|nr:hypothetical protein [Bradyrhizobium sp.]
MTAIRRRRAVLSEHSNQDEKADLDQERNGMMATVRNTSPAGKRVIANRGGAVISVS